MTQDSIKEEISVITELSNIDRDSLSVIMALAHNLPGMKVYDELMKHFKIEITDFTIDGKKIRFDFIMTLGDKTFIHHTSLKTRNRDFYNNFYSYKITGCCGFYNKKTYKQLDEITESSTDDEKLYYNYHKLVNEQKFRKLYNPDYVLKTFINEHFNMLDEMGSISSSKFEVFNDMRLNRNGMNSYLIRYSKYPEYRDELYDTFDKFLTETFKYNDYDSLLNLMTYLTFEKIPMNFKNIDQELEDLREQYENIGSDIVDSNYKSFLDY